MKIIVCENNFAENPLNSSDFRVSFRPDSSISKGNKPFFLPEFSGEIVAQPCLVAKIGKLGKTIGLRFAHRYYSEVAMAILLSAQDLSKKEKTAALAVGFDGATALSPFFSIENIDFQQFEILFCCNQTILKTKTEDCLFEKINRFVSFISQFCTLKTGDLLFFKLNFEETCLKMDDILEIFLDKNKVLEMKIK